jgi:hypothetical protein
MIRTNREPRPSLERSSVRQSADKETEFLPLLRANEAKLEQTPDDALQQAPDYLDWSSAPKPITPNSNAAAPEDTLELDVLPRQNKLIQEPPQGIPIASVIEHADMQQLLSRNFSTPKPTHQLQSFLHASSAFNGSGIPESSEAELGTVAQTNVQSAIAPIGWPERASSLQPAVHPEEITPKQSLQGLPEPSIELHNAVNPLATPTPIDFTPWTLANAASLSTLSLGAQNTSGPMAVPALPASPPSTVWASNDQAQPKPLLDVMHPVVQQVETLVTKLSIATTTLLAHPIWLSNPDFGALRALVDADINTALTARLAALELPTNDFQPSDDAALMHLAEAKTVTLVQAQTNDWAVVFDFRAWATGLLSHRGRTSLADQATRQADLAAQATRQASLVASIQHDPAADAGARILKFTRDFDRTRSHVDADLELSKLTNSACAMTGEADGSELESEWNSAAPPSALAHRIDPRSMLVVQPNSENLLVWVRDYQSTALELKQFIDQLRTQLMTGKRANLRLVINGRVSVYESMTSLAEQATRQTSLAEHATRQTSLAEQATRQTSTAFPDHKPTHPQGDRSAR